MQMKKRATALIIAAVMVLMLVPGVSFAADMSEAMQAAYDALEIPNTDDVRGSINLPLTGANGAEISWASSNEAVVSAEETENEGYYPTPAGRVSRGSKDINVTLTATITLEGETAEKTFDLTVKALPDSGVKAMAAEDESDGDGGYLFYFFKNNSFAGQQIFLAASRDGLNWMGLNENEAILTSQLGTKAVRDPYILRSAEGDRFFLIATDLDASGGQWSNYSGNGSKHMMVWESTDLVNWGEQRMVLASTLPEMGCTWAPEAVYDDTTQQYVVFWSAKNIDGNSPRNGLQTVYYATTSDFYTFSEPQVFVTENSANPGTPIAVIDTTIIKGDDGRFYRITKHEGASRVFLEVSDHLLGTYESVSTSNLYNDFDGVEGPEIFKLKDGRYCAILDNYNNGGYFPVITDNLSEGVFTRMTEGYAFAGNPRHGGVIRVSEEEYNNVVKKYGDMAETVQPDEAGSAPILRYDFEDGAAKDTVGSSDGALYGNAKVVDDVRMGKVLALDGTANTYLEIPRGYLDGRNQLTVSMDVKNNTTGNYFTFGLGKNDQRYFFTKVKTDGVKAAATVNTYTGEEKAESSGASYADTWINVTVTVSDADKTMKVYVNGKLKETKTDMTNTIAAIGKNLNAYIGKSFYSGDVYANMSVDNVEIYNRALSEKEIAEKYTAPAGEAKRYSLEINADEKGADITDGMIGLFFEDINFASDGGLYSEVVNNRSFEAYNARGDKVNPEPIPLHGWSAAEKAEISAGSENPLNANNPTYLILKANAAGDGVKNDCYSGFSAKKGAKYNASVYARGDYSGTLTVQALNAAGKVIGESSLGTVGADFEKKEAVLEITGESDKNATIRVILSQPGTVELDMISVIPQATFNGRDNGLRADLVEKLAELKPGFLRFPGGCIIEGFHLDNRYQWKHSVGPVEQRVQNWNRWQTHNESDEKSYGYCQTYGLGFYEYFLLCEDIGAKAVPVVSVGIACQYQGAADGGPNLEDYSFSSWDDLYNIYIKDALDLIEFANGTPDENWADIDYAAVDTNKPETFNGNWANLRALMGHPKSFNLEYIGVGNEQWNTQYTRFFERYEAFEEEIHKLYPDMKLIGTSGPDSSGSRFDDAWRWLETHNGSKDFTYAVDEHYYRDPDWFYNNINRYDVYDRDGFGVFAGEYACRWWGTNGNNLETALAEAAYMGRLERNSDVVKMASYAPLFAKEDAVQWAPDMIWFNTDTVYGSPDYYVQKMYSTNSGDYNVASEVKDKYDERDFTGVAGVGTWLTSASFKDFKVTDDDTGEDITPSGWVVSGEEPEKYAYTVTASSEIEKDNNPKENVMDGDLNTKWSANGTEEWLLCDLGEVKPVGKVGVAEISASDYQYNYAIQLSADGETFTTVYDGSNGKNNGNVVYQFTGNDEARYVKILAKGNSRDNNDWNAITEVEIFGECAQNVDETAFTPVGTWNVNDDGSAEQSDVNFTGAYLFANEAITAENYTITVKATKTDGKEGFLIPVMAKDKNNLIHWNVGGWSNTQSAFEVRTNGANSGVIEGSRVSATTLETGKEYELKVVVRDGSIFGYIDGAFASAYTFEKTLGPVYANTVFDTETGDIIAKLVNTSGEDKTVPVSISYSGTLTGKATQYLLTGSSLEDRNSADEPEKVSTQASEIDGISDSFDYELPAYSFVVLRIHTGDTKAVVSADAVGISVKKGEAVKLPETVNVTLSDGTSAEKAVTWHVPEAGVFANAGSFRVYGDIEGSEVTAVAEVTVIEEEPTEVISVDTEKLLAGSEATAAFNPKEYGSYRAIFAVYNGDELESVQTVQFSGNSFNMTVKLPAGRTAKLMLWTSDDIAPNVEAVEVK